MLSIDRTSFQFKLSAIKFSSGDRTKSLDSGATNADGYASNVMSDNRVVYDA